MSRLAKVVNVFAIRQVKKELKLLGKGFTLNSCQYDSSCLNNIESCVTIWKYAVSGEKSSVFP